MANHLPIVEIIPDANRILAENNTLILQAPPGAGKSTYLPLQFLNQPWLKGKKVLMLEPRRLAARSVAIRMAEHIEEKVGETIGFKVRFENKTSTSTQLEVVTEGILTRLLQTDNSLEDVGLVIFDEFHERSLHADLALTLCREIQQVLREDLRILIMSATLNMEQLTTVLKDTPILTSRGRQFPVRTEYLPQVQPQNIASQMATALQKIIRQEEGDILAFLPGIGEINRTSDILKTETSGIKIVPLYGDLPFHKQQEAIEPDPTGKRKIVLATSIAETSLTIEGIKIVVDSGWSRSPRFNPVTGLTKLETIPVTLDAADQRKGRAGRTGPGVCYRLWESASTQHLLPNRNPEILDADLAPMVLELAQWGVQNVFSLSWITPPPSGAVSQAKELLTKLKAIKDGKITQQGKAMVQLPTHPRLAHMLLEAKKNSTLPLATDLAALLEERDPIGKEHGASIITRLDTLRQYRRKTFYKGEGNTLGRIERLAASWRRVFKISEDNESVSAEETGKLIAEAWPERVAKQDENDPLRYRLTSGRIAKLSEHDPLITESWLAVAHLDAGVNEGKIFLAAPVSPEMLHEQMNEKEVISWDKQKGILIARKELRLGEILVKSSPIENLPEEEKIKILCQVIKTEGERLLSWNNEKVAIFQSRVQSMRIWQPEENWPDISTQTLLSNPESWLTPYLNNVRNKEDFQKLDLLNILKGILPWDLSQRLEELAPQKIEVPTGSMLEVHYQQDGSAPVLAVRLQEMFGLSETPVINEGKTKLLLHLLSPGYKPVQVTQDLKSFWNNTYPEVRKELRIRYKKHYWPEDPWTAEAVKGVKRKT